MPKQNGAEIARVERRMRVLQAKVAGASVRQIAKTENLSIGQIQKDVQRALGELAREHVGHADQIRALQMERYNQLLLRWYNRALDGEVEAIKVVLTIMDKINQINGVIPDKSLISIQQNSFNVDKNPVTFIIERSNNDNSDDKIPETPVVLEAGAGNIQS
tara:strand:+ start:354 stop:836 length:483 start_codon:yes stop_codon:yes gene_type:complete